MALVTSFESRIEDLAGPKGTITSDELEQFVSNGAQDIADRVKRLKPEIMHRFTVRASGDFTGAVDIDEFGDLVGIESSNGKEARPVSYRFRQYLTLTDSIHYASSEDPAFYVHNNHLFVKPATGSGYIFHIPKDYSINMNSGTIAGFPAEFYRHVVLYAAIQTLHRKMTDKDADLPANLSLPEPPVPPAMSAKVIASTGSVPTYSKPSMSLTMISIDDLSISASAPTAPSLPAFSPQASSTIASLPTAPVYTEPTSVPNFSDVDNWINTEEDSELASSRINAVNAEIGKYQADIQNKLNEFNKLNTEYQAEVQKRLQQAQMDLTKASKDSDINIQEYTNGLQKYATELQKYESDINKEVTSYQQNLQKDLQIWQGDNANALQKYSMDMQNELNEFNKLNTEYQVKARKDLEDAQLAESKEGRDLQMYAQEVAGYQTEVANKVQDFQTKLQKQSTSYQWMQTQYAALKAEYNEAFAIGV